MIDPKALDLQASYDRVAGEYARRIFDELEHKPLDRQLLDRFAAGVRDLGPACDLGCGPGHVARYLHEHGVTVVGVDLSPEMVQTARRLNPGLEFRQGDMRSMGLQDGSWGGIVAFYSLIHVPPPEVEEILPSGGESSDPADSCSWPCTSATRPCTWTSGGGTGSRSISISTGPRRSPVGSGRRDSRSGRSSRGSLTRTSSIRVVVRTSSPRIRDERWGGRRALVDQQSQMGGISDFRDRTGNWLSEFGNPTRLRLSEL